MGRLSQFDGSDESFEGIAGLAANKPPRYWVDPDLDKAAIELADMAQKFLRAETYARVKGRPEKRQAMAVFIGMNGRPAPILEEFDIADSDHAAVNVLIERVSAHWKRPTPAAAASFWRRSRNSAYGTFKNRCSRMRKEEPLLDNLSYETRTRSFRRARQRGSRCLYAATSARTGYRIFSLRTRARNCPRSTSISGGWKDFSGNRSCA